MKICKLHVEGAQIDHIVAMLKINDGVAARTAAKIALAKQEVPGVYDFATSVPDARTDSQGLTA